MSGSDLESTALATSAETSENVGDSAMTSVLQLGTSPWMRTSTSEAVIAPAARVPVVPAGPDLGPEGAEEANTASILKDVRTVQQKELESGARRELRVEKAEKEIKLSEKTEEHLRVCKLYFILGCAGLPMVHFTSVAYYWRELLGHDGDFMIKKYIYLSLIVGIVEMFLLILWFVIFQLLRNSNLKGINILNYEVNSTRLV